MTPGARASLLVAIFAGSIAGCTIEIDDWSVACGLLDEATCRPVAEVALDNLAWREPARPQGTITVDARGCPARLEWPSWADPSQCWQVVIPLAPGDFRACMVIARRPTLGGFGQVAGDEFTLPASKVPPQTRGCPA
jgi:hypothetical protein